MTSHQSHFHRGRAELRRRNALLAIAIVFGLVPILIPMAWMLLTSLRPNEVVFQEGGVLTSGLFTMTNYTSQLRDLDGFMTFVRNGFITSTGAAAISLFASVAGGFALSKLPLRGRRVIALGILASQMFPLILVAISLYSVFNSLGLLDTVFATTVALSVLGIPFGVWMMKGFFDSLPADLDEAAFVDGAHWGQILWYVVLPLTKPGLIAVSIFSFMNAWNNLLLNLTLTSSRANRTVPAGFLLTYVGEFQYSWADAMAGSVMVSLPMMVLFIGFQRYMVQGMTAGAVKG